MILIILSLLITVFTVFTISPLFSATYRNKKWIVEAADLANLQLHKQEILSALNDLEYDLQMKKISPADYREAKEKLMKEGVGLMEALDRAKGKTEQPRKKKVIPAKAHPANLRGHRAEA
jgi:hypothetical protein